MCPRSSSTSRPLQLTPFQHPSRSHVISSSLCVNLRCARKIPSANYCIVHSSHTGSDVTLRCTRLSIYRGRLALYVINDLHHDDDMKKGLKIACCGAPSFVLYSSALKCRSPLLFFTSIPLSHTRSFPLPGLPTSLSKRCSSCSSPSGSSSHSCLRL